MNGPRIKALLATLLGAATVVAVSGCELNDNADVANGRALFVANCGTCHTLAEAGTNAAIGPNLDASFAAARAVGQDSDTIKGVVSAQIESPRQTDPADPTYMAPEILTGQDAKDVATYIGSVAGVPGIGPPTVPGGPGAQVFANNGCGSCHTLAAAGTGGTVGPNLDNELPGQSKDMIRQSIVDPNAQIVNGFPSGVMPENYEASIDPKALDLLVQFLAESAGKGAPASSGGSPSSSNGGDGAK